MRKTRGGKFIPFLILVLLVTLLLEGFAGFAKPVGAFTAEVFGFEDGLLGWHTGGYVGARSAAYSYREDSTYWAVIPDGILMGELQSSGSSSGVTFSSVVDALGISEIYSTYLQTWFPPAIGPSYAYTDVELLAGESFTVAWNYLARGRAPYIDPSFCSMVNLDQPGDIPTVDGYVSQIAMLGSIVPGSSNYPTGDEGCTGWQTMTFQAAGAGTYRVGFAVFNSIDDRYSSSLFLDLLPGVTFLSGDYFTRISRATDGPPPPVPMVPMVVSSPADEITSASATLYGSVTYDGLSAVTERGFAIGVNYNPTIDGSKLTAGTGAGLFTSSVTGLTQGVTYHFRAYAINGVGVSYGADMTFTTRRRHIVIFPALPDAVYGDADISGFAFILSGYPLTYESSDPDVAVIVNDRIHITGVGTTVITASRPADEDYDAVTEQQTLTVAPRLLTVSADAVSKTYGDVDPELGWTVTTGTLVTGDSLTGALSRTEGERVGNYAIEQGTLTAGDNYATTFIPAELTINIRTLVIQIDEVYKTYGDPDPELTWSYLSEPVVEGDPFHYEIKRTPGEHVGAYHISVNWDTFVCDLSQYNVGTYHEYLLISPRAITVTADAGGKAYGDADPELGWTVTSGSLVTGDPLAGTLARTPGEEIGSFAIGQGTLLAGSNYTLSFVPGTFSVTPRLLTITADAKSKTYGDADPTLTWRRTAGSLLGDDAITGDLSRIAGENAGSYAIGQGTLYAGDKYAINFETAELAISQRPITVTADDQSKTYGELDPALTWELTAGTLVDGDAFTGDLNRIAGENVGSYAIGQGSLSASDNYAVTYESADLTIDPYLEEQAHGDVRNGSDADNDGTLHYLATARAGYGFAYWSDGTTLFSTSSELVDPVGGIEAYTPVIWPVDPTTDMQVITLTPTAPTTVTFLNGAVRMILPSHADPAAVLSITPNTAFDETDTLPEGLAPASRFFTMLRSENLAGIPIRIEIDLEQLDTDLNDDEMASLVFYHWDEAAGTWERTSIATQGVDEEAGLLWAELDHFSTYGLFYEADVVDTGDTTNTSLAGLAVLGGSLIAGSLAMFLRKRRMGEVGGEA